MTDPETEIWIGEATHDPVGQVRFQVVEPGVALIDIAVAPESRGHGRGAELLATATAACGLPVQTLRAEVLPDNHASLRLFRDAGFQVVAQDGTRVVHERRLAVRQPGKAR